MNTTPFYNSVSKCVCPNSWQSKAPCSVEPIAQVSLYCIIMYCNSLFCSPLFSPADARLKVEVLPGATEELGVVNDAHPVKFIHRHIHIVRVGPAERQRHRDNKQLHMLRFSV